MCLPDHASSRRTLFEAASAAFITARTGRTLQTGPQIRGKSQGTAGEYGSTSFQPWPGPARPSSENSTTLVATDEIGGTRFGDRNCDIFEHRSMAHSTVGKEIAVASRQQREATVRAV